LGLKPFIYNVILPTPSHFKIGRAILANSSGQTHRNWGPVAGLIPPSKPI